MLAAGWLHMRRVLIVGSIRRTPLMLRRTVAFGLHERLEVTCDVGTERSPLVERSSAHVISEHVQGQQA
jgi:hypothetical protein